MATTQRAHAPVDLASVLRDGVNADSGSNSEILTKLLRAVRTHLRMEAAFVSKFAHGRRIFQVVDCDPSGCQLSVGASDPLEDSYCARVADGRLPELICEAGEHAAARELEVTRTMPVGAHLSIPLRFHDGAVYGTFCCFSRRPDHTLNPRDLELMRTFADIAKSVIEREPLDAEVMADSRQRIDSVLRGEGLTMVYQPVVDIESGRIVGFESLSRFSLEPPRTPDVWFEEASWAGLGMELEAHAIDSALARGAMPDDVYIACNVSPEVVIAGKLPSSLSGGDLSRVVLEITEHSTVEDYVKLDHALRPLRARGMRLAVDDAGAGYASFRHILSLSPEFIKLDISLTRDIDRDRARRSLAAALIGFARETESELIAEGVETASELATLRALGAHKAQGYLLGRPMPFDAARQLVERQHVPQPTAAGAR